MEDEQEKGSNIILIKALISCCVLVVVVSFYFFYYKKDFNFIVEISCDPSKEICSQRDCSNPDDCPPNGLSDFKRYILNAGDFKMCENEDCESVCSKGAIKCEPIECVEDLDMGESCSSLELPASNE